MSEANRRKTEQGLTYVELVAAMAILSLIGLLFFQAVDISLASWRQGSGKAELLNNAQRAMERMVSKVRKTTWVLLPQKDSDPGDFNAYDPNYPNRYYPRNILAMSANIDNDGDGLADEDPSNDITGDGFGGIMGIDDDNDDPIDIDEKGKDDDDEAGGSNEDPIDGIDNDGDGMTDEDPADNFYKYFNCGNNSNNDDADETSREDPLDPLIYYLDGSTLMERLDVQGVTQRNSPLAENVSEYQVVRRRVDGNTLIDIHLKLDDGRNTVALDTTVFAFQRVTP